MEDAKIITQDGNTIDVSSIFFVLNNAYYLIYTDKVVDENGYVVLSFVKVGKDSVGFVGIEITDPEELKAVQDTISKIVEDKKTNTNNNGIQYASASILNEPVRITGSKTFRLKKEIAEQNFGIKIGNDEILSDLEIPLNQEEENSDEDNVIIDYREKFFEEQDKNEELQKKIDELEKKLNDIKEIIG